jgi:hypothetical protein
MKHLFTLALAALAFMPAAAGTTVSGDDTHTLITNDTFWRTTSGTPIYSQGGGIFRFPDPETGKEHYYWYGVHYQGAEVYLNSPTELNDNEKFVGVTCYRSDDLVNWSFVNNVLVPSSVGSCYWIGRLGVAYIPEAKVYALLVQLNDNVLVATCSTPTGNFTKNNLIDMTPLIGTPNTGDQTVFTDTDTGKSYLVYSYGKGRSKIYISQIGLKDGKIGLLDCHEIFKGAGREGNCMFKYKGKYYVCASDLYGWNASNVYYLVSDNIYGPYTPANNMQLMPGAADDYGHTTQTGFFYTVHGTEQETVVYCGDRWAEFAGNGNGYNQWCPLSFEDGTPHFNSLSRWSLDAKTGRWQVAQGNNYVKNGSFDADRVAIPSGKKPRQSFLRGWTTTVMKGNAVVIGSADSPQLNAWNTKEDRATVAGNWCLNITDKTDFRRKVAQKITSTASVPLSDGTYRLTLNARCCGSFSDLHAYALSGGATATVSISHRDDQWHTYTLDNVRVSGGTVEVGFIADGEAGASCRIDDVVLTRNDEP